MASNGVFCLEGEWSPDLRTRESVLPILELLERLGQIKFIHRNVGAEAEVRRHLKKWSQSRYGDYQVLFIASHGDKGQLTWSSDRGAESRSSLDELAGLLDGAAAGCYIYFGSCLTLFDRPEIERFVAQTGAAAVLGYRKEVDWIEAAAFEVLLISWIANHNGRPKTLFDGLMKRHGELAKLLKFAMGTSRGVYRAQDRSA